ncbi:hypothetical protein OMP38_16340 [Cohnella ginsengisoli]|uniref:Uncharacterized protein n=1 Tax=Cohnella ginsengisoli TaxID=425004 RepID=A0A9X4KHI0_9BACL|nr:hypothetical protein [Cohnella ginsengisoli]MDG0792263.1 hypothetical protein [Cohnella ginsengisoli]
MGTLLLLTKGDNVNINFTNFRGDLFAVLAAVSWELFKKFIKKYQKDAIVSTCDHERWLSFKRLNVTLTMVILLALIVNLYIRFRAIYPIFIESESQAQLSLNIRS